MAVKVKKKRRNYVKEIVADYTLRINKGVAFLDRKVGRAKWLAKIDEQQLDLSNGSMCMVGQSFGQFWDEINGGTLSKEQAAERGFYLDNELGKKEWEETPHGYSGYDILTHLWHCKVVALKIEAGMRLSSVN